MRFSRSEWVFSEFHVCGLRSLRNVFILWWPAPLQFARIYYIDNDDSQHTIVCVYLCVYTIFGHSETHICCAHTHTSHSTYVPIALHL